MGIIGNVLKTAAVIGASAIPGIGAVAGPLVAGATGGPGLTNKLTSAATTAIGNASKGSTPTDGGTPLSSPSVDVKASPGFAGAGGSFSMEQVANDPLGQIAALQVMNGSENLADIFKRKGFGAGRF